MSTLLAIDPGGAVAGYAFYVDGVLFKVGLSRSKSKTWGDRARDHAVALSEFTEFADRVVCESMTWRGRNHKGSPQVLIDLNGIAGHLGREFRTPGEWKGMVPREVESARTQHALSAQELALLQAVKPPSLAHNAWSAVGIGLSVLKRAHKRCG